MLAGLRNTILSGLNKIQVKIILLVIFLFTVTGTFIFFQLDHVLYNYLDSNLEDKGVLIGNTVAATSTRYIRTNTSYSLYTYIESILATNNDIMYIIVSDGTGHSYVDSFPKGIPQGLDKVNILHMGKSRSIVNFNSDIGLIKDIAVPIAGYEPWYVRVGMKYENINYATGDINKSVVLNFLAVTLSCIAIMILITKKIVKPISELTLATDEITNNNYSVRVSENLGSYELESLAGNFNIMAYSLQKSQEHNRKLEQEQKALLANTIELLEGTRHHISRELHDELGQSLAAIQLELALIESSSSLEEITKNTRNIRGIIRDTRTNLKDLIWELRPASLDNIGLEAAVRKHLNEYLGKHHIGWALKIHKFDKSLLNQQITLTAFRIIQEAVTNAVKHARANKISVVLECSPDLFSALIEDNGVGFDVQMTRVATVRKKQFGLMGMVERAEMLGGEVTVESSPGAGTSIFFQVPLKGGGKFEEN